jgi:murein DD-endopeptidase MepM/ murein hydrolase activator NlpD
LSSPVFSAERRIALVIGNAKYKEAPLSNPVNDANDMEAVLKSSGFRVIKALDATQKQMNRAIFEFGELLTHDSVALFYYAGHGLQVRGKNYLIPVDAEIKSESSVRVESVDVDGVLDQLSNSELNVVILDACRNNPFERRTSRSLGAAGGLAQMEAPKGSLIAYSTAPGKTAADGEGRNGLYTQALLRYIKEPGLTIEQVFKNVRREVARSTRDAQMPWESSSMTGEFYFSPTSRPSVALNPQAVNRPPEKTATAPVPAPAKVQEVPAIVNKQLPENAVIPMDSEDLLWIWPSGGKVINVFSESSNKGIDMVGRLGDPVIAAADGQVVYVGTGLRGYGELVLIKHNANFLSAYAHNRKIFVKEKERIARGQKIAEMGDSDSEVVKLHFEIRKNGKPVDPLPYLPKL